MPACRCTACSFIPKSIASEHGHLILKNFLDLAAAWNRQHGRLPAAAPARQSPAANAPRTRPIEPHRGRRFQSAHRQGRDRRVAHARGSGLRLRPHDVGRSDALADGRPADGVARARRNRRRDHRRGHHHARQDAGRESAAQCHRRGRHRRRCLRLVQHLDLRGLHRGGRRRAGRQARQSRAVVEIGRRRRAGRARRQDRADARPGRRAASAKPASVSCSRPRIIRR